MREVFKYFMDSFSDKDFLLQQKARNLFIMALSILILIPIVVFYAVVIIGNRTPELLIPSVIAFFFTLFALLIFKRGYFSLFAHSIVIMLFIMLWVIIFLDKSEPLARGDSIIYIYILLTFTPLIVLIRQYIIFIYYGVNILIFFAFMFLSDFRMTVPPFSFNDFISDISVGMIFSAFISYQIFNIHRKALAKANVEAEKNRNTNIILEKTVSMLSSIIESPPNIAIFSVDLQYRITAFNSNFYELILQLFSIEVHIDKNLQDVIGLEYFSQAEEQFLKAKAGNQVTLIQEIRRQQNDYCYEMMLNPIIDREGAISGITVFMVEITERKKSEEALIKASKIESLGIFAGGIAHDFNNLLMAIMGSISLAKYDIDPKSPGYAILSEAENASWRAKDLTHQLLTFSRGGDPVKKVASISALLRSTSKFVLHGSNVKCNYQIADDLHNAFVDVGQIGQVIQNIVLNARQAMASGGELTIWAENSAGPRGISGGADEKFIHIAIEDQGDGISDECIDKIFDPFFTTKSDGNGLGLAVSYSIVKKHGGIMRADRSIRTGARIEIFLPATNQAIGDEAPAVKTTDTFRGRVLLMDDDNMVRETAANMLQRLGLDVLAAKDGAEALGIYKSHMKERNTIDLVILDLTIPGGMNGIETIARLRDMDPHVKAVVSSGYSNDPIMANFSAYGFIDVITKPYRMEDVQEVLQKILGQA